MRKLNLPLGGVLVLLSLSRHLRFGPNTAYSARLRVGICRLSVWPVRSSCLLASEKLVVIVVIGPYVLRIY